MGLGSFISSLVEVARLRADNARLQEEVAELREQLFGEINSNRTREGELLNAALEAADIRARAGVRQELGRGKGLEAASLPARSEAEEQGISEADIDRIAQQYIDQSPYPYDEATTELLKAEIRAKPEEHGL